MLLLTHLPSTKTTFYSIAFSIFFYFGLSTICTECFSALKRTFSPLFVSSPFLLFSRAVHCESCQIHLISLRLVFSRKQKRATVAEEFWLDSCCCVSSGLLNLWKKDTFSTRYAVFVFWIVSLLTGGSFIAQTFLKKMILLLSKYSLN